jgi:hypothetical protein
MTSPLLVKISRDGKEIGTYEAKDAVRLLESGTLKETDFYWHEGMTDWAPLSKLQASEARRQLAERALQQKQEETIKAEQLAQEKAKAKDEEDRAVAEAVRTRMEKRKENIFTCSCCKDTFEKPIDPRGLFWKGFGVIILSCIVFTMGIACAATSRDLPGPVILGLGLVGIAVLSSLWGLLLILSSALRSPFCPGCHSTNYSRPNKGERPVFD